MTPPTGYTAYDLTAAVLDRLAAGDREGAAALVRLAGGGDRSESLREAVDTLRRLLEATDASGHEHNRLGQFGTGGGGGGGGGGKKPKPAKRPNRRQRRAAARAAKPHAAEVAAAWSEVNRHGPAAVRAARAAAKAVAQASLDHAREFAANPTAYLGLAEQWVQGFERSLHDAGAQATGVGSATLAAAASKVLGYMAHKIKQRLAGDSSRRESQGMPAGAAALVAAALRETLLHLGVADGRLPAVDAIAAELAAGRES